MLVTISVLVNTAVLVKTDVVLSARTLVGVDIAKLADAVFEAMVVSDVSKTVESLENVLITVLVGYGNVLVTELMRSVVPFVDSNILFT